VNNPAGCALETGKGESTMLNERMISFRGCLITFSVIALHQLYEHSGRPSSPVERARHDLHIYPEANTRKPVQRVVDAPGKLALDTVERELSLGHEEVNRIRG
jgi:hypothetical protein